VRNGLRFLGPFWPVLGAMAGHCIIPVDARRPQRPLITVESVGTAIGKHLQVAESIWAISEDFDHGGRPVPTARRHNVMDGAPNGGFEGFK